MRTINQTEVRVEGVQQFDLWRRLWVPTSTRKSSLQYNFSGVNSCEFYWFLILSASEKQFSVEIGKKWLRGHLTTPSLKNGFVRTTDLVGSGVGWCGGQKTYHFVATGWPVVFLILVFPSKKTGWDLEFDPWHLARLALWELCTTHHDKTSSPPTPHEPMQTTSRYIVLDSWSCAAATMGWRK